MKRLSIILSAVLLLLVYSSAVMAQNNGKGNDNKTTKEFVEFDYWQPIDCDGDGELEDLLFGNILVQWIVIQKDGNPVKVNAIMHGEATSDFTTEVFKVHEKDLMVPDVDGIIYAHFNLIGNQGSHYVGTMIFDARTFELTVEKLICLGN